MSQEKPKFPDIPKDLRKDLIEMAADLDDIDSLPDEKARKKLQEYIKNPETKALIEEIKKMKELKEAKKKEILGAIGAELRDLNKDLDIADTDEKLPRQELPEKKDETKESPSEKEKVAEEKMPEKKEIQNPAEALKKAQELVAQDEISKAIALIEPHILTDETLECLNLYVGLKTMGTYEQIQELKQIESSEEYKKASKTMQMATVFLRTKTFIMSIGHNSREDTEKMFQEYQKAREHDKNGEVKKEFIEALKNGRHSEIPYTPEPGEGYGQLRAAFGEDCHIFDAQTKRVISKFGPVPKEVIIDYTPYEMLEDGFRSAEKKGYIFEELEPDLKPDGVLAVTIKRGDKLAQIARKFGVDEKKIRDFNNMRNSELVADRQLFIPGENVTEPNFYEYHRNHQIRPNQVLEETFDLGDAEKKELKKQKLNINIAQQKGFKEVGNALMTTQNIGYGMPSGEKDRYDGNWEINDYIGPNGKFSIVLPDGIVGISRNNRGNMLEALRGPGPHNVVWNDALKTYVFEGYEILGPAGLPRGTVLLPYSEASQKHIEAIQGKPFYPQILSPLRDSKSTEKSAIFHRFSAEHGEYRSYYEGNFKGHDGIDIGIPNGTNIYASHDGKVVDIRFEQERYGNSVLVYNKPLGILTRYSHLQEVTAREGGLVGDKTRIAKSGQTGRGAGPHLDFEVYVANEGIPKDLDDWSDKSIRKHFRSVDPLHCIQAHF